MSGAVAGGGGGAGGGEEGFRPEDYYVEARLERLEGAVARIEAQNTAILAALARLETHSQQQGGAPPPKVSVPRLSLGGFGGVGTPAARPTVTTASSASSAASSVSSAGKKPSPRTPTKMVSAVEVRASPKAGPSPGSPSRSVSFTDMGTSSTSGTTAISLTSPGRGGAERLSSGDSSSNSRGAAAAGASGSASSEKESGQEDEESCGHSDASEATAVRYWPMKSPAYRPSTVEQALVETPSIKSKAKVEAPAFTLELEAVMGFRGKDSLSNVVALGPNRCAYFAAAAGVVVDNANAQIPKYSFFTGHDDDISAIAAYPDGKLVATGQLAPHPKIVIWDSTTTEAAATLGQHEEHDRAIAALAFSSEGDFLLSVGRDDNHTVCLWDWRNNAYPVATFRGGVDRVLVAGSLRCNNHHHFITAGVKHIRFTSFDRDAKDDNGNRAVTTKKGVFNGKLEISNIYAICAIPTDDNLCATGGSTGEIGIWDATEAKCLSAVSAHRGSVFSLCEWRDGVVSGGKDGLIKLWLTEDKGNDPPKLSTLREITLDRAPWVRSLCLWKSGVCEPGTPGRGQFKNNYGTLFAGTNMNEVHQFDLDLETQKLLTTGHTAETWGLAILKDAPEGCHVFATSGNDKTISIWGATFKGEYARLASAELPAPSRCCDFSPNGKLLVAGLTDGTVVFLKVPKNLFSPQEEDFSKTVHVVQVCGSSGAKVFERLSSSGSMPAPKRASPKRGSPKNGQRGSPKNGSQSRLETRRKSETAHLGIDQVRFSPIGNMVAVATHENVIVVLRQTTGSKTWENTWVKNSVCRGHTSFVSHLDWSTDAAYIQSNSGAYEYAVWDAGSGKQVHSANEMRDISWCEHTLPFSWATEGIWGDSNDGTDVNAVCKSHAVVNGKPQFLITGDDFSSVNMFNWPTYGPAAPHYRFSGHASHVMNVRITNDDRRVITVGGLDACTFVWRVREIVEDLEG